MTTVPGQLGEVCVACAVYVDGASRRPLGRDTRAVILSHSSGVLAICAWLGGCGDARARELTAALSAAVRA